MVKNSKMLKFNFLTVALVASCFTLLSGCGYFANGRSSVSSRQNVLVDGDSSSAYPQGVVEYVYEEPARDVIDVPPGLDPEGHYYRPAHQEVVESLPGRYRFYKSKVE